MKNEKSKVELFEASTDPQAVTRPETRRQYSGKVYKPYIEPKTPGLKNLVVPDSGMSIAVMLQRTARGLPISSNAKQPVYNGEKLLPNWQKLDLIDRQRIIEQAKEDVARKKEMRDKQMQHIDSKRKAYYEKLQKEAIQKKVDNMLPDKEPKKDGA